MFKKEKDFKFMAPWKQEASQTTVLKIGPSFGMLELSTPWGQTGEWSSFLL